MDKETKKEIKNLRKNGEYDKIFTIYGAKVYKKYVPNKYKKQDLKKLKQEGRYEAIYSKYGEEEHNKVLKKAMFDEIKGEKGTAKAISWWLKEGMKKQAKMVGMLGLAASVGFSGAAVVGTTESINENSQKYEKEIEEYNENISDYVNNVKKLNLNDTQTFMKLMDDMWKNIQGYGNPEKNILGFFELDLANEDGYGVCRNMASDMAKKLDKLGYNAKTIVVQMGDDGNYKISNIKRKILDDKLPEEENENGAILDFLQENIFGNHMVTLVKVPEDDAIVVLDPTNPGLGIYYQGEIKMFNSGKENGLDFDAKQYINSVFNGTEGIKNTIEFYADSWKKPNLSFKELENKYGIEAQNKALEEVRAMSVEDKTVKNDFLDRIKVDLSNKESKEVEQNRNNIRTNNINEKDQMEL